MFNRGFRRDDRGNSFRNNSNMSHGQNAPSLMSVSPWEGGVVPGGGSSILGTPQMLQNTQSLLSPQAQVLAQNLSILSNLGLLQPQIQTRQSQGLPSLINMGSAMNRSMGSQNSDFRQMNQQPNRGMVNNNRFQDQRMRYGRQEVRRPEPFNKNRPRPSQTQTSQQKLQSYRPLNSKVPPLQAARKSSSQDADDLAKARADVRGKHGGKRDSTKKSESDGDADADAEEEVKKEEGDEVVKKRDWKKEKKADVIEIDDDEEDGKAADVKMEVEEGKPNGDLKDATIKDEKDAADGEGKGESEAESKEKSGDKSKTDEVVITYNCHVCKKDLSDQAALLSHVRTAVHKRMMGELEETYALKVKKIRDQMRANEQLKERDWARNRGGGHNVPRGHCKMCDLTFFGNITAHRKAPLHLKLKSFLHPNCAPCNKEFPARMEWDMHRLTPEHFKVLSGIDKKLRNLMGSNSNSNEPNYARLVPKFPEGLDSVVANMDEEHADMTPASEGEGEAGMKYEPTLAIGLNMLVHGQHCGVCNKFFAKRPDAVEHCRTRTHFDNYAAMKAKLKEAAEEKEKAETEAKAAAEAKATAEAEAEAEAAAVAEAEAKAAALEKKNTDALEEKESESTESTEAVKTAQTEDKVAVVCLKRTTTDAAKEEGNWKRSRTTAKDDDDEDEDEDDKEILASLEGPDDDEAMKILDDLDKYDPLEPTSPAVTDSSALEMSLELSQSCEAEVIEQDSPAAKPANKARRGRKRK